MTHDVPAHTILAAAISDVRTEVRLINPDFRRVSLMLCDAILAALDMRAGDCQADDIHTPAPADLRTRSKPPRKTNKPQ